MPYPAVTPAAIIRDAQVSRPCVLQGALACQNHLNNSINAYWMLCPLLGGTRGLLPQLPLSSPSLAPGDCVAHAAVVFSGPKGFPQVGGVLQVQSHVQPALTHLHRGPHHRRRQPPDHLQRRCGAEQLQRPGQPQRLQLQPLPCAVVEMTCTSAASDMAGLWCRPGAHLYRSPALSISLGLGIPRGLNLGLDIAHGHNAVHRLGSHLGMHAVLGCKPCLHIGLQCSWCPSHHRPWQRWL